MEISSVIKGAFLFALLFFVCFFAYDQIFSDPKVHQGIVLDKVFIPQHTAVGPNTVTYGVTEAINILSRHRSIING